MDIFNINIGGINLTVLMLIISMAVVLPVQLLLCFKVRSRRIRFMPMIILSLSAVANILMIVVTPSWKRQIFTVGAVYMAFMMLMCGIGWAVWAIIERKRGNI